MYGQTKRYAPEAGSPISSRERSLQTWGDDGTGQGRRKRLYERAQDRRSELNAKRRREAKLKPDQIVSFMVETAIRLQGIAVRQMRAGVLGATRADVILSRTVKHRSSGFIAIAPSAEDAAFLAAWLRSPGVDEFCEALNELDTIAGTPTQQGSAVDLAIPELKSALTALESSRAADAIAAAKLLRGAGIVGCHARVFLAADDAGSAAEALHAVGGSRSLVTSLDRIAGRTELRPF